MKYCNGVDNCPKYDKRKWKSKTRRHCEFPKATKEEIKSVRYSRCKEDVNRIYDKLSEVIKANTKIKVYFEPECGVCALKGSYCKRHR